MAASYQTLADVYSDVRYIAGKDSTTLTNADLLRMANKYYLPMVRELVGLNEDIYAEISYTDLVANQKEYALPVDNTTGTGTEGIYGGGLIKLQRVEINYDGSDDGWKVANPLSMQEVATSLVSQTDINDTFDRSDPKYSFKDRSVWIFPVPESTDDVATDNANLYIYWIKRPDEMTATTDIPDLPKDFLNILTEGILIDVFRKYGRMADSDRAQHKWTAGLFNMKEKEASPDMETQFVLKSARKNYK